MPTLRVELFEGRTPEQKRALAKELTDACVRVLGGSAVLAAASTVPTGWAIAQARPLKVGLMLPYSGTFAKLGENITIRRFVRYELGG